VDFSKGLNNYKYAWVSLSWVPCLPRKGLNSRSSDNQQLLNFAKWLFLRVNKFMTSSVLQLIFAFTSNYFKIKSNLTSQTALQWKTLWSLTVWEVVLKVQSRLVFPGLRQDFRCQCKNYLKYFIFYIYLVNAALITKRWLFSNTDHRQRSVIRTSRISKSTLSKFLSQRHFFLENG